MSDEPIVSVYVYTMMNERNNIRQPATMFPWVEGLLALFKNGGMCQGIDGSHQYPFTTWYDEGDVPGYISSVVYDAGPMALVQVTILEKAWPAMEQCFDGQNPLVMGYTPKEWRDDAVNRRNFLYNKFLEWRPQYAQYFNSAANLATAIGMVPTNDPAANSFKAWMLNVIGGDTSKVLPNGLVNEDGDWMDFTNAQTLWTRWRAEAEGTDYKVLMRLWEMWCIQFILESYNAE